MSRSASRRKRRSRYNVFPRWVTRKRVILSVTLMLSLALASAVVYGVRLSFALAKTFHTSPISAALNALGGGGGSAIDKERRSLQRINIVLYGYGGVQHAGGDLTDSIMVVSIQPVANHPPQVAEISIPRDWYVRIPLKNGQATDQRINFAYAAGMLGEGPEPASSVDAGAAVADPLIEHLLGVGINYFVGVNFDAFKQAVNAVGGINIDVPTGFTDNQYPAGECSQGNCGYETVHFNAGVQHMNGATALIYARSRHGNNGQGSDFARSRRQQQVIVALKAQLESIGGIGQLPDVISALGDNVLTNLTISDAESLYGLVQGVNPATIEHVSIDDTNFLYDCGYPSRCGGYYLYAHDSSFKTLSHYVQDIFPPAAALAEGAHVRFVDESGRGNDASGRWAGIMSMVGFHTINGGKGTKQAVTQVIDQSGGADTAAAAWLAAYFGVSVITQPPPAPVPTATGTGVPSATPAPTVGDVIVVLGSNEEQAFLGDPGIGN
ncbi:MAG TPA: LCP family protein [Candidatus Saccharimonadales bacterium]|nr:LCP family protein [Candidatus Saccharimonadales bacterium]